MLYLNILRIQISITKMYLKIINHDSRSKLDPKGAKIYRHEEILKKNTVKGVCFQFSHN